MKKGGASPYDFGGGRGHMGIFERPNGRCRRPEATRGWNNDLRKKFKIKHRDVEIRMRSVRFPPRGYVLKELRRNSRFLLVLVKNVKV